MPGPLDDDQSPAPSGVSSAPHWSLEGTLTRGVTTLRFDLAGNAGETVGVTGDIGSGKTTVLEVLTGRVQLDDGVMRWNGEPWLGPSGQGGPATTAIVHQRPADHLPEYEPGLALMQDRGFSEAAINAALDAVALPHHVAARDCWTYSGAEAQRVSLLLAVLAQPELLLLDEPCSALDKRTKASVTAWLAAELERRTELSHATVIASSDPDWLEPLCQRVVQLD